MGLAMSPFAVPASDVLHPHKQQNATNPDRIVPVLTITESMKLDGRAVLCLEVEAAAEELPPTPQDTDLLRLLDLLLAIAVLLFCVVVGDFSTDVRTVGLVLAAGLAGVAVAGLKQHCGEALGTLTPRIRQTKKAPTQPIAGILASAQYAIQRLQLELAAAVILTAYLPVAVWECAQDLAHQLPSAAATLAAACTPLTVAQRYVACLQAISAIGEEDARPLFPSKHHKQHQQCQQQQQQQQAVPVTQTLLTSAQYGLEWLLLEAAAAVILTAYLPIAAWEWVEEDLWPAAMAALLEPWQAFWHWIECLDALSTQLDKDEEDGRPLYTWPPHHEAPPQPRPLHRQHSGPSSPSRLQAALPYMAERVKLELVAAVILAAYLPIAAWEFAAELLARLPAAAATVAGFAGFAYTACQQYIACLQAIGQIGEEDARPLFPSQQQKQQNATAPGPSASTSAAAAGATSGSFLNCLEAIGELGGGEGTPAAPQQQQKQQEGVPSPAAARLSPLQAAKGLLTCLEAIGRLDSSTDDSSSNDDSSTFTLEQLSNLLAAKAPTPVAAAPQSSAAAAASAVSTARGLLDCLTAIEQLDSSEGPSEEQLYALAAKPYAPSAAAAAPRMSPMQAAKGFMASLTAIGELGSSDSPPLEQHGEEVAPAGVGVGAESEWVSPVGMVRAYVRSLQAIADWDGSEFQLY